jgi:hypothetical protein
MSLGRTMALLLEKPIMLVFRRHADYAITMQFVGRVVNQRTQEPIPGVQVLFVDTSFDSVRRKNPEKSALKVGETGDDGKFDLRLRYLWSVNVVWLCIPRIGKSFKLRFERDGYVPEVRDFNPHELPYEEGVLQVGVPENIGLEPSLQALQDR